MSKEPTDTRMFWVVLSIEIPDTLLNPSGQTFAEPIGFMPVFESKAAALAHAGGVFAVHAIRLATPQVSQEPVGGQQRGR